MRLLICIALCAGCSIQHVSDELACTGPADCTGGRSCVNGFCVVATSAECPGACDSCDAATMTCTIDVDNNGRVTCPAGWNCAISCPGNGTCRNVDCGDAKSCAIQCSGRNTCGDISCGDGRCAVSCAGEGSCKRVACKDACACDVACSGANSCDRATCPSQCEAGAGCASQPAGCSHC
ncbi:MAG: hypothetical protein KF773_34405 [Deltaproteobacteria bacterium]|nr:hypothetical protein [Deltaproteobacteria bacterium]